MLDSCRSFKFCLILSVLSGSVQHHIAEVGLYQLGTYSVDVVAQLLYIYLARAVVFKSSMPVQPCLQLSPDEMWCHTPFALLLLLLVSVLLAIISFLPDILE